VSVITKSILTKLFASIFFYLTCVICYSAEITLFDTVTLGRPVNLPKCASTQRFPKNACLSWHDLELPYENTPSYLAYSPTLCLKEGALVGVQMFTRGLRVQTEAYLALTDKFGRASTKKLIKFKTYGGATHDGIHAVWRKKDVEITFYGLIGDLSSGSINISLPGEKNTCAPKIGNAKL
jgi:hypothetical protein